MQMATHMHYTEPLQHLIVLRLGRVVVSPGEDARDMIPRVRSEQVVAEHRGEVLVRIGNAALRSARQPLHPHPVPVADRLAGVLVEQHVVALRNVLQIHPQLYSLVNHTVAIARAELA